MLSLVLGATLNAQAEQCQTVKKCRARIEQDQVTIRALYASQAPKFIGIAMGNDNLPILLNQTDAIKYCLAKKAHLPSIRELAQWALGQGAKDLVDWSDGSPDKSYYLIQARNADDSLDQFYFSNERYIIPKGDMSEYGFWSSSLHKYSADTAYFFSGLHGNISNHYLSNSSLAVFCVAD